MKPFYTFNSFSHEERKKMVNFFRNHVVMRWLDLRFFYGGETSKREREDESCDCSCNQKERENFVTPDYGKVCS